MSFYCTEPKCDILIRLVRSIPSDHPHSISIVPIILLVPLQLHHPVDICKSLIHRNRQQYH